MRENRPYGSEGGAAEFNPPFLPLSGACLRVFACSTWFKKVRCKYFPVWLWRGADSSMVLRCLLLKVESMIPGVSILIGLSRVLLGLHGWENRSRRTGSRDRAIATDRDKRG